MATEAEVEEVRVPGGRSQVAIHQGQVDYIEETYGVTMKGKSPAEIISLAYATRVEWRQTETYHELKDGQAAEREAAAEAKALAREEAAAAKAETAKAAKAEKPAAKATAKKAAPAKKAAAKKGAKGKADPFA